MSGSIFKKPGQESFSAEDKRKQQILEAAALVFSRLGYAASIDQIAEEMGVTKGHIYYYFSSKQDILFQIFRQAMDLFLAHISSVNIPGLPPDQRLKAIFKKHITVICENRAIMTVFMDLRRDLLPEHWREIAASRKEYEKLLQDLIREGISKGFFAAGNEQVITFTLLGSINWVYVWFRDQGQYSAEKVAELMADYLLRGLKKWPGLDLARSDRTIKEIALGERASFSKTFTANDIQSFAGISGYFQAVSSDERPVARGDMIASLIAPVMENIVPISSKIKETAYCFGNPVYAGDTLTVTAMVTGRNDEQNTVTIDLKWINQDNLEVASGRAVVELPDQ